MYSTLAKRPLLVICLLGTCFPFVSGGDCAGINPTGGGPASTSGMALFTFITQTDPYEQWSQFPEAQGTVASSFPHGPMARIFINAQVEDALSNFTGSLPDGSIIVKENLGEGMSDKTEAMTMMWKVAGFDPDNNDWFWAKVGPDGQVNAEGKVEGCINCHNAARNNDFVFLHQF